MINNGTDVFVSKMTFANLRTDQRANAIKNTTIASQNVPRTKSRLSVRQEAKPIVEVKKAFATCLCEKRLIDGKEWLFSSPDCPVVGHGSFKENLAFNRPNNTVEGAGRDGRRKVYQSDG